MWKGFRRVPSKLWRFVLQIIGAFGALACIFVWVGVTPQDMRRWQLSLSLPHWVWLIAAFVLFAFSIVSSLLALRRPRNIASSANLAVMIAKLADQVEFSAPAMYPLKLRMQLRNDSASAVDVQLNGYRPNKALPSPKGFPVNVLQLRLGNEWLPKVDGLGQIAVLPRQQFQLWIGLHEGKYDKHTIESYRGEIGTLLFLVNGQSIEIAL